MMIYPSALDIIRSGLVLRRQRFVTSWAIEKRQIGDRNIAKVTQTGGSGENPQGDIADLEDVRGWVPARRATSIEPSSSTLDAKQ